MPLPASIASDLAHVFEHAGDPVVYGDQQTHGTLREEDLVSSGTDGLDYQHRATVLSLPAGALTGVMQNSPIWVDGVEYRVRNPALKQTGRVQQIVVAKVPT